MDRWTMCQYLPQHRPDPGDQVPAHRVEEELADVDDDHLEDSAAAGQVVVHSVGADKAETSLLGLWANYALEGGFHLLKQLDRSREAFHGFGIEIMSSP